MRCGKCGQELNNESVFCPNCGSYVITAKNKPKSESGSLLNAPGYYKQKIKKKSSEDILLNKETADEISAAATDYVEDGAEMPKKSRSFKTFFIGFLVTVLLLGSAFYAGYYAYNHFMGSSTGEYTTAISKLKSQIDKSNSDMANAIKKEEKTLPVSDILKQISSSRKEFNTIEENLDKIIAPSVYSDSNANLAEAIKLNKSIFQQLELILRNPLDPDMKKSMDLLTKYIDDCMADYTKVDIKGVNLSIPNEILSITSRVQPWVKQKQTEYASIASLIASFSRYFDGMAKLFTDYDSAAADFNKTLTSVRNGQEQWDKLFTQIDNSEKIIKTVKESYQNMNVPKELDTINKRFGPILDEQLSYYTKLRTAAQAEQNFKKQGTESTPATANNTTVPGGTTTAKADNTKPQNTAGQVNLPPVPGTKVTNGTQTGSTAQTGNTAQAGNTAQPGSTNQAGNTAQTGSPTPQGIITTESDIQALYQEVEKINTSASSNYQKFAIDLKLEKDKYLDPEYVQTLKSGK